jgi:hypothetical protein
LTAASRDPGEEQAVRRIHRGFRNRQQGVAEPDEFTGQGVGFIRGSRFEASYIEIYFLALQTVNYRSIFE